jgi:hypothetical protein
VNRFGAESGRSQSATREKRGDQDKQQWKKTAHLT